MSAPSRSGFPADRSLVDLPSERATVSVVLPSCAHGATGRPVVEIVAFAALFVFARMLQQDVVQSRLVVNDGGVAELPVAARIAADATLSAALRTTRIGAGAAEIGGAEIDLAIRAQAGDGDGPGTVLSFVCDGADLHLSLDFDAARLSPLSARDFLEKIGLILDHLAAAPETRCAELALLTPAARGLMPDLARDIPISAHAFVPATFFRIAAEHADDPAVANDTRSYTYAELSRAVSHLANRLVAAGLVVGDTVAIDGVSSFGVLAGMLAVLAAGGVVVTLDRALPDDRRAMIAELSRARLRVLVRAEGDRDAAAAGGIVITDWPGRDELDALEAVAPPMPALPIDASAYIFFTSGSTGVPKGVLGTHLGLAHFLAWQRGNFQIGRGDHTAQLTALSFDVVLRDILFPLTSGACVHIPRREMLFDVRRMLAWIAERRITAMHCVPSLMKAWLLADTGSCPFRSLRYIFFAGEPLTDTLLRRFAAAAGPETRIVNLYGPTETTLAKLANRIDRIEPGVQPVGNPQPGTDVVIVRDRRVLCGLWEIGEIAIRTPYRSKGYIGNDELTRQVFVRNPFRDDPDDLLYYTGDLGRYRSDGKIEIFGRIDAQIKIRGIRIEPNEIEAHLLKYPGIRDAAITTRAGANAEKALVGLVVPEIMIAPEARAGFGRGLCDFLRQRLPEAMVPARVVVLDSLPYLPNGKLDRKSIGAMDLDPQDAGSSAPISAAALDDGTRRIVAGFEEALGRRIVDLDSSFVDLGGDSLSYIRVSMLIEDQLGWVPAGWERMSLAELARLRRTRDDGAARSWWTRLDATVVFRALAIFVVTLSHTGSFAFLSATSTLFVISGMNFSKFLRPGIHDTGRLRPTLHFIARFGIPAGLWEAIRSVAFHQIWIPDLLLLGTLFKNPKAPHYTFWFLDVLASNTLLLAMIALLAFRLRGRRSGRAERHGAAFWADLLWCLAGLGMALAQVSTGWWDGDIAKTGVAPFKWFWLLALGVLLTQANTKVRKVLVTGLLGCIAAGAYSGLPGTALWFSETDALFFASVVALIWLERVPVPRFLQSPLVSIASATLFIYIANYAVMTRLLPDLGVPAWWPVQVGAAIAVGIIVKIAWDQCVGWADWLFRGGRRLLEGTPWPRPAMAGGPGPHFPSESGASGI